MSCMASVIPVICLKGEEHCRSTDQSWKQAKHSTRTFIPVEMYYKYVQDKIISMPLTYLWLDSLTNKTRPLQALCFVTLVPWCWAIYIWVRKLNFGIYSKSLHIQMDITNISLYTLNLIVSHQDSISTHHYENPLLGFVCCPVLVVSIAFHLPLWIL